MGKDDILREIRQTENQLDELRYESQRSEQDYREKLASADRKMTTLYQLIERNYESALRDLQQQQGEVEVEDLLQTLQKETNRWKETLESAHYQHRNRLDQVYEERNEELFQSKLHLERELEDAYCLLRTLE